MALALLPAEALAQDRAPESYVVPAPVADPDSNVEADPEDPPPRTDLGEPEVAPGARAETAGAGCSFGTSDAVYPWADPTGGTVTLPDADEGDWWVEARAQRGTYEVWWVQGPYDVARHPGTSVVLDPPAEVRDDAAGRGPVLVTTRLVLKDTAGATTATVTLPRLVAELSAAAPVYAPEIDLVVSTAVLDGESYPSTDLPDALAARRTP